jgi:hypothetical protein
VLSPCRLLRRLVIFRSFGAFKLPFAFLAFILGASVLGSAIVELALCQKMSGVILLAVFPVSFATVEGFLYFWRTAFPETKTFNNEARSKPVVNPYTNPSPKVPKVALPLAYPTIWRMTDRPVRTPTSDNTVAVRGEFGSRCTYQTIAPNPSPTKNPRFPVRRSFFGHVYFPLTNLFYGLLGPLIGHLLLANGSHADSPSPQTDWNTVNSSDPRFGRILCVAVDSSTHNGSFD